MAEASRPGFRVWLVAFVGVLCVLGLTGPAGFGSGTGRESAAPILRTVRGDAGDAQATTTHDGPMVRRRTAIAVHPVEGADRSLIGAQLRAGAARERLGPLSDATFAVFSPELLKYLVPEIVVVLPEGASLEQAENLMMDYSYPTVAFHLVESVLVHDLTFAVVSGGVPAGDVRYRVDREGILSDSLGQYETEVQSAGLTVRYFGALLSDGQVLAVQESMARAAHVAGGQVMVEPSSPGEGVDLSSEPGPAVSTDHHG